MKVTTPIELLVQTTKVTSNAPELDTDPLIDPAEWNTASSYVEGDRVSLLAQHKVYECIQDADNTVASPEIDITSTTPHWFEVSYTNKWRMFCYTQSLPTTKATNLTVTLTPQVRSSNLAILALTGCTSIVISASNGGSPVTLINCLPTVTGTSTNITKSTTLTITGTDIASLVIYNLPAITTIVYTLVITGPGVITCKHCVLGWPEYLGDLQADITRSDINFSTIDRDTYGTVSFVRRRSVPKLNYSLNVRAAEVNRILSIRDQLNATPALWNAMDDNVIPDYTTSLLTLGFYRDFSITLDNPIASTITLEVEEI